MTDAIKSLTLVEIDVDHCSLTYGVAPCMAVLGTAEEVSDGDATGTAKCFNTRASCQDRENFTNEPVTLRFAMSTAYLPDEFEAIPNVESVEYDPGRISLGENLGERASLTITFKDQPWSDTGPGFDPYHTERAYDPFKQGTFWGKFRARQKFLQGRPLRWLDGTLGQALDEMDVRHFVIESFNGPTPDGRYTLTAKDMLKLADGDRAQAPVLSNGRLAGSISTGTTSVSLTPTDIGDAEYPAAGYLNLGGKEIVAFTRTGDALTLTRAQFNTEAVAHDAQTRAQLCLYYESLDPSEVLHDLLTTYAGVDPAFIDLDAWASETGAYYQRLVTGMIAEPTSVRELAAEIILNAALAVWWDPVDQQVRLQVLRQIATDAENFSPSNTIEGSLGIKEQPDKRVSQVWVYYGQINPLEGQDDPSNYAASEAVIETDAEEDYGAAKIKKVYSRWIAFGGASTAQRLGQLVLKQYKDAPRKITFGVARHGADTPTLGEGCRIMAQPLQDQTGAAARVPGQITRLKATPARWEVEVEEANFAAIEGDDVNTRAVTIGANVNALNGREQHDLLYPAPLGGETVNIYIEEWVAVGSTGVGVYAFDTGDWPSVVGDGTLTDESAVVTGLADTSTFVEGMAVTGAGIPDGTKIDSVDSETQITLTQNATADGTAELTVWTVILNVYVRGKVQGAGGRGGRGGNEGNGSSGSSGGPAFKVRVPVNLILNEGLGQIFGGSGGGGGAGVMDLNKHRGGGGGGGAGIPGGPGGSGPGDAQNGSGGSPTGGGQGGRSWASFAWTQFPHHTSRRGGNGGAPGGNGGSGEDHGGGSDGGNGGSAGAAIDGISFVTKTGTGDIRGPQIN